MKTDISLGQREGGELRPGGGDPRCQEGKPAVRRGEGLLWREEALPWGSVMGEGTPSHVWGGRQDLLWEEV